MDPLGIQKAEQSAANQIPGLEAFITETLRGVTTATEKLASEITSAFADGITQVLALGQSLDGATVTVDIPRIVFTVRLNPKPTATP